MYYTNLPTNKKLEVQYLTWFLSHCPAWNNNGKAKQSDDYSVVLHQGIYFKSGIKSLTFQLKKSLFIKHMEIIAQNRINKFSNIASWIHLSYCWKSALPVKSFLQAQMFLEKTPACLLMTIEPSYGLLLNRDAGQLIGWQKWGRPSRKMPSLWSRSWNYGSPSTVLPAYKGILVMLLSQFWLQSLAPQPDMLPFLNWWEMTSGSVADFIMGLNSLIVLGSWII